MSRSRLPVYIGVAAAGGVGYYLYTAGGSPSAAAKQAKIDAMAFPDKPTYGREAGAKIDNASHEAEKVAKKAEDFAKGTKNELLREIEKADQKIEETASKAKGWFGSGK